MTLLKDLIAIPERVFRGDFVLKLAEGVSDADRTLATYVVTPQLELAFDEALKFVASALESQGSKAAYLHGSFGAGKSHFMAVLSLLLNGHAGARSVPELANVVARHNGWTQGRRFLVVPFHMIGAASMESAILGGYAEHVRRLHPGSPVPGFYLADQLFKNAAQMRRQIGDASFFALLNGDQADTRWGALDGGWDATSFEAAMLEPPTGDERMRLVGDLIERLLPVAQAVAAGNTETFVPLDDGLSILAKHAKALGYDAVVLFLDELILWLASRAADVTFITTEGTKLVKLVEAQRADRPLPLVSFVARQRDLRELVGETLAAGAVQTQFADALRHWEARFHKITLEDRNLPAIAERRLLKPVSPEAKAQIDAAFAGLLNARPEVLQTLLTDDANRELFRKLYPFSPALIETLIAVSAVLQRERTALKLMLQMLVERRDELELGQLIGVGDLWDVLADGDEPFSEGMRLHFDNARRLWQQKLLPRLERQHSITWVDAQAGRGDAAAIRRLRNDGRILKTLLLAALAPEVRPLRALTAARLAALNHGSLRTPIPGQEAADLLRKCRDWAAEIGEIKISDDLHNPVLSIAVTGVDLEPIIESARGQDNAGNRKRKIRELLFAELGIVDAGELFTSYELSWRGTRRSAEIVYDNVRTIADDRLRAGGDGWAVLIDFPFDEPQHSPADDRARLQQYSGPPTRTLAWLPQFLSERAQRELRRLVILDYLLTSPQRFEEHSANLSVTDRHQARALASNQRDQLRARLRQCLEAAYGIAEEPRDGIERSLEPDEQLQSLEPTFQPRRPAAANLKEALDLLLGQALAHQFPAHPVFEADIKAAVVRKVWVEVEQAAAAPDQRQLIGDRATRQIVRGVVYPLGLGEVGETHLYLPEQWKTHFLQCHAREPGAIGVRQMRGWIDEPRARGLPTEVQNLLILAFAAQTQRSFKVRGAAFQPTVDSLPDEAELIEQRLPERDVWDEARRRLGRLFGVATVPQTLNAGNLAIFEREARAKAAELRRFIDALAAALPGRLAAYVAEPAQAPRLRTVQCAQRLLTALARESGPELVAALGGAALETSEAAVAATLGQAQALDERVRLWPEMLLAIARVADHRAARAQAIVTAVAEALASDEHAVALKPKLAELESRAIQLLSESLPATPSGPPAGAPPAGATPQSPPVQPPAAPLSPGRRVLREGREESLGRDAASRVLNDIGRALEDEPGARLNLAWSITRDTDRS